MTEDIAAPLPWRREAWIVTAILLLAAVLRFAGCGRHSLWFDEVVAMQMARAKNWPDVMDALGRMDLSRAPLHPLMLHGWLRAFGTTDAAGRSLSAFLGTLAVVAGWWAAREALGIRVALWAACLLAACPLAVHYSQETRMYSLLLLFTCLAWALLFSFRRSAPAWKRASFGLAQLGLFYSHPLGMFMLVALAVGYLADRGSSRLGWRGWLVVQLGVTALAVPWLPRYFDHAPHAKPGFPLASRYFTWPQLLIGGNGLVAWVAYALILLGIWRFRRDGKGGVVLSLVSWFAIPLILLYAYSRARVPIFGPPRYLLFVGPAFLILLARGLDAMRPWSRGVAMAGGALLSAQALWLTVYAPEVKPGWRDAAAAIRAIDPSATVVVRGSHPSMYPTTLRYYLGADADVVTAHEWSEAIREGRRDPSASAWFIHDRYFTDPERPVPFDQYKMDRPMHFDRVEMFLGRLTIAGDTALR
ncbi:MAG: glycosyltransferase family 39 protein [Isosphaeraceae bacterium]